MNLSGFAVFSQVFLNLPACCEQRNNLNSYLALSNNLLNVKDEYEFEIVFDDWVLVSDNVTCTH